MKKVIDGALYNTDTAQFLGEWNNELGRRDLNHVYEELYRTKSGKYFLYGEGGPMSKYSVSTGNNSWSGGEHIEPMSPDAAREWAEKHLTGDEYEAIFGEVTEASDTKDILKVSIDRNIKQKLIKLREETGKSISQLIEEKFAE